jgi:hypothetical protein
LTITIQHTQETLCRAHVYALAGSAGVNLEIKREFDYGVDGTFNPVIIRGNRRVESGFPLDFQAKATVNWELQNGVIVYDLETKNYNDIVSRGPAQTTMILILLCLPRARETWHEIEAQSTTLRHCCYWTFLSGEVTSNEYTKRIEIPASQFLTPEKLNALLAAERIRRQTQYS